MRLNWIWGQATILLPTNPNRRYDTLQLAQVVRGQETIMQSIDGPFGQAVLIERLPTSHVEQMYLEKCGAIVEFSRMGISELEWYQCEKTGMRFWRPEGVAGDEQFYQQLSRKWPFYYQDWRWEYGPALDNLAADKTLLEVGCGKGYFLRATEGRLPQAQGLEFNTEAIREKVTKWDISSMPLDSLAAKQPESFDIVCSYQVLEHVVNPAKFIASCLACLRPGGLLLLSTPDPEYPANRDRLEAFDLPPHHMNQFPLESYERIAEFFDLRLVRIYKSPRHIFGLGPPTVNSSKQNLTELKLSARNFLARILNKRGPTLLVKLEKT